MAGIVDLQLRMEFYRQDQAEFPQILAAAHLDNWENTYAANLGPLVGRRGARAKNDYNQWRTTLPYLGSLTVWCICGHPSAPGNPHVQRTDHSNGGQNLRRDPDDIHFFQQESVRDTVRALFPWPAIQARRNGVYIRYMAMIDRLEHKTYLVKLVWNHAIQSDHITVNIQKYNVAPHVQEPDVDAIARQFQDLGFE